MRSLVKQYEFWILMALAGGCYLLHWDSLGLALFLIASVSLSMKWHMKAKIDGDSTN